jgi:hypothetical protein
VRAGVSLATGRRARSDAPYQDKYMKTPREILFARHQAAAPKLDAIRQEVVRELNNKESNEQSWGASLVASFLGCSNRLWLELVWPCRRIWAGLAAVWILIFIVNISQTNNVSNVTGKGNSSGYVAMSLQAQQRWMNELFADRSPPDAERPRNFSPKPRTKTFATAAV